MKTKNTRELRLRANAHTKLDHVKQGTYGKGRVNGKAEYQGCAIGCLSTPHRKRDLIAFLREKKVGRLLDAGFQWFTLPNLEGSIQRRALRDEFGIDRPLAKMAEGLFEAQVTHAEAIDFVRDFAHAVPEGVDIRERDVLAFLRSQGLPKSTLTNWSRLVEKLRPDIVWGVEYRYRANAGEKQRVREFTATFLTWLRSGARVSKMPKQEAVAA